MTPPRAPDPDPTEPTYPGGTPTTFRDLILAVKRSTGLTYPDLAARSGLGFKLWQQRGLGDPAMRGFSEPETIPKLARGLDVPVRTIVAAQARELGLDMDPPQSLLLTLMPAGTELIPDEEAFAIATLVRAAIARARVMDAPNHRTPSG